MILVIIMSLIFLPEIFGLKNKATNTKSLNYKSLGNLSNSEGSNDGVHFTKILGSLAAGDGLKQKDSEITVHDQKLITWEFLKSNKTKFYIETKLTELNKFERDLPIDYSESRKELISLIESLQLLYKAENFNKNAIDVIKKIEEQEMSVSMKMLREFLPRGILIQWSKIDLSFLYQSSRTVNYKLLAASHFDPKFQIFKTEYSFYQNRENGLMQLGNLEVTFILEPETVSKIDVYKDGIYFSQLSVVNDFIIKRWGRTIFNTNQISGIYSFYIEDIMGNKVIKNYNFNRNQNNLKLIKLNDQSINNQIVYIAPLKLNIKDQINLIDNFYLFQTSLDSDFFSGEGKFSF